MKYEKILLPLDGSERAETAIEAALPLTRAFNGEIIILGVMDVAHGIYDIYSEAFSPVELQSQVEALLTSALKRAQVRMENEKVKNRQFIKAGIPHEEIAHLATQEKIDLIIMTTHARKGLSHLLLGSVTEKVIRTAPCPVLVLRTNRST